MLKNIDFPKRHHNPPVPIQYLVHSPRKTYACPGSQTETDDVEQGGKVRHSDKRMKK